jgi:uncharacterized protein with PIN domain
MTVASDAKREEQATPRKPRLVEGRFMRCPRCKRKHDVLRFVPMGVIEEYVDETNPIYKCPSCRWVFSPALTLSELSQLLEMMNRNSEGNG